MRECARACARVHARARVRACVCDCRCTCVRCVIRLLRSSSSIPRRFSPRSSARKRSSAHSLHSLASEKAISTLRLPGSWAGLSDFQTARREALPFPAALLRPTARHSRRKPDAGL
eukprot:183518-Pleurochrysis_carterae.AAC.2